MLASALPGEGFLAAALTAAPLILSPPVVAAMTSAQASVPLFLLLVLFARALGRGRAGEAGLWWGVMTALKSPDIVAVPLECAIGRVRNVPVDGDVVRTARHVGICLGDC